MRNEIEKDLNAYFLKRFGRSTEDGIPVVELYEIVAKPNSVDMDSPEVQNLVAIIMQTIMSSHIQRYTDLSKLWNPLNFLCRYCGEDGYLEELQNLWDRGTIGMSIPDLQRKISRGGAVPALNGKRITFDKMNYSFKQVEQRLFYIFFDVRARNNIKTPPINMSDILGGINDEQLDG